jgi:hypothetical protein
MPVQLSTKIDFRLCIFYSVNRIVSSFHSTSAIEMGVLNSTKPHVWYLLTIPHNKNMKLNIFNSMKSDVLHTSPNDKTAIYPSCSYHKLWGPVGTTGTTKVTEIETIRM